jgi:hypothetical protein
MTPPPIAQAAGHGVDDRPQRSLHLLALEGDLLGDGRRFFAYGLNLAFGVTREDGCCARRDTRKHLVLTAARLARQRDVRKTSAGRDPLRATAHRHS